MYRFFIKNGNIYSVDIQFSKYRFTVFPMIYMYLYESSFKLEIGLFSFIIEVSKFRNMSKGEVNNMLDGLKV